MPDTPKAKYFLTSPRIGFRHWSEKDLGLAFELWGNLEVTKLIGGPFSEQKIRERLQQEILFQRASNVQYWPIFELTSDKHIGCCGLRPYLPREKTLELGFHLRPEFWGAGFAREAAEAVIQYAKTNLEVDDLFAGHNPNNENSRLLLKKLGFRFMGDVFYAPTKLMHPSYLLSLTKKS